MKTTTRRTLATVGAVGVLGAAFAVPAIAHDEERIAERAERMAEHQQAFADALADKLGLDADTVATAIDEVRDDLSTERRERMLAELEERLADRVTSGDISQEVADELLEHAQEGEFPFGRGNRGDRGFRGGPFGR